MCAVSLHSVDVNYYSASNILMQHTHSPVHFECRKERNIDETPSATSSATVLLDFYRATKSDKVKQQKLDCLGKCGHGLRLHSLHIQEQLQDRILLSLHHPVPSHFRPCKFFLQNFLKRNILKISHNFNFQNFYELFFKFPKICLIFTNI